MMSKNERVALLQKWGVQPPLAFVLYPLAQAEEDNFYLDEGAHIAIEGGAGYPSDRIQKMLISAWNEGMFIRRDDLFFWNKDYSPKCC